MTHRGLMAVDIGNSWIKLGWFESLEGIAATMEAGSAPLPQPIWTERYPTAESPPQSLLNRLPATALQWHLSSVHREGTRQLQQWVASQRHGDEVQVLTCRDLPIELHVESPERVGLDRLAAAVAANALREPSHAAIVIGSGTAVTVNVVGVDGAFEGGAILPGFGMQARALFGADQLPLTEFQPDAVPPSPLGKNTDQAIRSGLFWGTVGAVRELIARLSASTSTPADVFVTGGDVSRLSSELGGGCRFVPNMVLAGIALAAARRRT